MDDTSESLATNNGTSANLSAVEWEYEWKRSVPRVIRGILLGFFGLNIPATIYYKRLSKSIQKKAIALALAIGTLRTVDSLLKYVLLQYQKQNRNSKDILENGVSCASKERWTSASASTSSAISDEKEIATVDKKAVESSETISTTTPTSGNLLHSVICILCGNYSTAIAGAIATAVGSLIDQSLCNSVAILWLLIRAVRPLVPSVPYGAVIIMCLSASQILSTWIRYPDEHSPSYLRFLDHQGGKSRSQLNKARATEFIYSSACALAHPGISCTQHLYSFFLQGLKRALPVYVPIHLGSLILALYRKRMHLNPSVIIDGISYSLRGLARSCVFLSSYCTIAWYSACMYFKWKPGVTRSGLFACTWIAGLTLLIERSVRHPELASYCLTHALNSIYNYSQKRNWVRPRGWVAFIALSLSIASVIQQNRNSPLLMNLLFGKNS